MRQVTEIGKVIEGMAAGSLRCVAFAYRDLDPSEVPASKEDLSSWKIPEGNLTFLVVVGIKVFVSTESLVDTVCRAEFCKFSF